MYCVGNCHQVCTNYFLGKMSSDCDHQLLLFHLRYLQSHHLFMFDMRKLFMLDFSDKGVRGRPAAAGSWEDDGVLRGIALGYKQGPQVGADCKEQVEVLCSSCLARLA